MEALPASDQNLLAFDVMQEAVPHVAGGVEGTSTQGAFRSVTITAADGFDPADWDRVAEALNAHDDYTHWEYQTLEDGRMEWRISYRAGT